MTQPGYTNDDQWTQADQRTANFRDHIAKTLDAQTQLLVRMDNKLLFFVVLTVLNIVASIAIYAR